MSVLRSLSGYAITRQRERELIRASRLASAKRAPKRRNPYDEHGPRLPRELETLVNYYRYRNAAQRVIAAHSWGTR